MKKLLLSLCAILVFGKIYAQSEKKSINETKIILIGSAHKETAKIKKSDFYSAIKNCKPDLILIELDSVMLNKDFTIPNNLMEYFEPSIIDSLLKKDNKIKLRPFDIEGRNKFFEENLFYQKQGEMFNEILNLYKKDSLNIESKVIIENFMNLNSITNGFNEMDLKTINSEAYDNLIEIKLNSIYKYFPIVLNSNKILIKHNEHLQLDSQFWEKRNNAMAKNIIQFSKLYQGKTIVVVTGSYHKYFLKSLLEPKQKECNYKIQEYYIYDKKQK